MKTLSNEVVTERLTVTGSLIFIPGANVVVLQKEREKREWHFQQLHRMMRHINQSSHGVACIQCIMLKPSPLHVLIIVPRLVVQHDNNEASVTHHRQMGWCYACKSFAQMSAASADPPSTCKTYGAGVSLFHFCSFFLNYFNENITCLWLARFGRLGGWDDAVRQEDKNIVGGLEVERREKLKELTSTSWRSDGTKERKEVILVGRNVILDTRVIIRRCQ